MNNFIDIFDKLRATSSANCVLCFSQLYKDLNKEDDIWRCNNHPYFEFCYSIIGKMNFLSLIYQDFSIIENIDMEIPTMFSDNSEEDGEEIQLKLLSSKIFTELIGLSDQEIIDRIKVIIQFQ